MPLRRLSIAAITAVSLLLSAGTAVEAAASPGRPGPPEPTVVQDSLNAPVDTVFDDHTIDSYLPLWAGVSIGPRITLARPTVLTEVGGFVNANPEYYTGQETPFSVEIHRADGAGLPVAGEPLASAPMTDDRDGATWRYESAKFRLFLEPGTYFAVVRTDAPPGFPPNHANGIVSTVANGPGPSDVVYVADFIDVGVVDRVNGANRVLRAAAPFRIVGCVNEGKSHGRACKVRRLG